MKRGRKYLLVAGVALIALSCQREDTPRIDLGFDYYPLEVGAELTYAVDSIVYDEFTATVDTFRFELRETCKDTFRDAEGRTAYRFERSMRHPDSTAFSFRRSFYVVTDGVRTEKVENNLREVVLVYPPVADEDWNANAFNTKEREDYEFGTVHRQQSFGSMGYDSVVQVIQQNDTDNFIIKRFSEEHYAKHVGLVQKRYYHIETQFEVDSGLLWIQTLNP